jgi:hypothetical protein
VAVLKIKDKDGNWIGVPSIRGEKGDVPQLSIGTIETLPPGSDATATITGTPEKPILNLGIPKGDTGTTKESDPTVPDWAKQPEKPEYTANEVGAQPAGDYVLKSEMPSDYVKSVNGTLPDENGNVEIEIGNNADVPKIEALGSVITIEPNKFYVFPEMASLDITLGGEIDASIVQEYKFRFTSGATATTLTLPEDIKGDITINANSVVEISIVDGYAVSQSWAVSE